MHGIQTLEVHAAVIHHVETARFDRKHVEHIDIVQPAVADVDELSAQGLESGKCARTHLM